MNRKNPSPSDNEPNGLSNESSPQSVGSSELKYKSLRVWPPILLLALMVVFRGVPKLFKVAPEIVLMIAAVGPAACGILIVLWWLTLSRASWLERLVGVVGIGISIGLTMALIDKSMKGPAIMILTIPMGAAAFAIAAVLGRHRLSFNRTIIAILCAACGFGISVLLRSDGLWGNSSLGLHWRWTISTEEQLLADRSTRTPVDSAKPVGKESEHARVISEWPDFGVQIERADMMALLFRQTGMSTLLSSSGESR